MRLKTVKIYTLIAAMLLPVVGFAQTIPVGTAVLEDAYRRGQLAGEQDSLVSMCIRPVFPDSAFPAGKMFQFKVLPITFLMQYTTHHPFSLNDGAMIPSRGLATLTSAGVFAKIGPLSIQFRPEHVYAQNRAFDGFPAEHSSAVWSEYWEMNANIDLPEQFGDGPHSRFNLGQSSVRLNFGPASLGISNENLWWGPGTRNSLLMSNTAPGFKHLTLNSTRPIRTPIGSFEFQLVAGRIDSSGYNLPVPDTTNPGYKGYYKDRRHADWVYFNGVVATWQPRWVKGLFLGATRSFQVYREDMGTSINSYLPVILPLSKENEGNNEAEDARSNQLASVFMRWFWQPARAEIYVEFGRDDHAWNFRDFFLEPEHSSAWLAGFRKLIPLKGLENQYIQVALELTHMENSRVGMMYRSSGPWYLHSQVKQGYTHQGQMLGAGIGPGSNLQTLDVAWVKGYKVLGLRFERFVHNNDFHYIAIHDIRAHWVDMIITLNGQMDYLNFLFFTQVNFVKSYNYEHLYQPSEIIDSWWNPGKNVFNFQVKVGVSYRFE